MADPDAAFEEKAAKTIEQIGRRVAELRRKAGWSQKEFAEVLNSSVQWVSLVETGRQNLRVHTMVRLADKLGVDAKDLWKSPAPERTKKVPGRGRPRKHP